MLKYAIKRIITAVITAYLVATLTFFIMNLVPGGPFLAEKAVTPQAQAAMEAKYGLDKPLGTQYITYMGGLTKGDLGLSLKKPAPLSCFPPLLFGSYRLSGWKTALSEWLKI